MGFAEVVGDLFTQGLPALGHGCNCRGSMGAGIAVEFGRRWPDMYAEYRRRCAAGEFQLGDVFVWEADDIVIYNLATQLEARPPADRTAIRASVRRALQDAERRGLARVGVPRVGAGLGGLAWDEVRLDLRAVADESTVELVAVSLPERPAQG